MRAFIAGLILLLPLPALAQQGQPSPPETALQINGVIGTWAQTLVQQGRVIESLQKQLADAQKKISELETKPTEKKE